MDSDFLLPPNDLGLRQSSPRSIYMMAARLKQNIGRDSSGNVIR
ncbi:MAG: hypothetical protein ACYCYM_09150 [Saccharofermentanales bacterium]